MKQRFSTYDVICMTAELQSLVGLRVNQIYDIDNKTYLIKFQNKDVKVTLLMESGIRFHTTSFEWPKNPSPSGFTMKLRKHLKNKRLESLQQMGSDRILDFQFGIDDAAYHLILELYDRGNIILCDHEMTILNVLRPHTEGETVRFVVREKYPEARARVIKEASAEIIRDVLNNVKKDDSLKQILMPVLDCGPTVLTHVLLKYGLSDCKVKCKSTPVEDEQQEESKAEGAEAVTNKKGKKAKEKKPKVNDNKSVRWFDEDKDFGVLVQALDEANTIMQNVDKKGDGPRGFIIQKSEIKPATTEGAEPEEFLYNVEYHPILFEQFRGFKYKEFPKFDLAVDEFYSTLVGQKIDLKTYQQECEALKKLSNVKKDHEKRLEELNKAQKANKQRAELITRNQELIDSVLFTMRSLIANQLSWDAINDFVKTAQSSGDAVAKSIKQLKLETNHVALFLTDPYATLDSSSEDDSDQEDNDDDDKLPSMVVDIDLGLSAYANATRYYDQKRSAAQKEHRTIVSSTKALKNAERKTQQHLKEVRTISNITKARKVFWFEKFYWFISSENYLVIGGRDQQQNELIVKRYLRANDIYVHADIQGASSIVIRNPFTGSSSDPQATPPPKTLLEAGAMAISYSVAWDAKVTTSANWVRAEQVSKTAPTGEYLDTGSFMIRGKKNFLPPCHLILGLSVMFKLEESSIARHAGERCVRNFDEKTDKKVESDEESRLTEDPAENIVEEDAASNASNGESSDNDDEVRFPDTHIKIGNLSTQVSSESNIEHQLNNLELKQRSSADYEEEGAIIHAAPQQMPRKNRIIQKEKHGGKKKQLQKQAQKQTKESQSEQHRRDHQTENKPATQNMSKHQKKKMKIIKSKYKDQDEEEMKMRMEILQSAGRKRPESKEKDDEPEDKPESSQTSEKKKPPREKKPAEAAPGDADAGDEDENAGEANDVDMLNSLTGCPSIEDELLFALPVVAPYNALQNYKYKVKITPGTARRGKTSKTAFMMFLKEKTCSNQEKDLIKAIKHDAAARNMPGKVKMSAPQMQRLKHLHLLVS